MIKLIASDLDGTLLQDGTQELTPHAISLIHSLTQKGIHFVAASGRQYTNERIVFDKIKDEISYIGENGSICMHQAGIFSGDNDFKMIRFLHFPDDPVSKVISDRSAENKFALMHTD